MIAVLHTSTSSVPRRIVLRGGKNYKYQSKVCLRVRGGFLKRVVGGEQQLDGILDIVCRNQSVWPQVENSVGISFARTILLSLCEEERII